MGVSRYGFANAWSLLKALPGQQGYMGSIPPSLVGMLERGREQGVPGIPRVNRMVERDLSPITDDYASMLSSGFATGEPKGREKPMPSDFTTQMQDVGGFKTEPEEGFFTGREKFLAREGLEAAARRQLGGNQRGGRVNVRGGSQSGINAPLRGQDDEGQRVNPRATRRSPSTLRNLEGMQTGAKLGGRSAEFIEEEPELTDEEKLAEMMRDLGMDATAQAGEPAQAGEQRGKPYKSRIGNDELMEIEESLTAIHGPEMASRIVQSMIDDPQPPSFRTAGVRQQNLDPQGDRPSLGRIMQGGPDRGQFRPAFPPDEATQAMLGGGAGGQAALQQRLMDLAAVEGTRAGRSQTQIDRQA